MHLYLGIVLLPASAAAAHAVLRGLHAALRELRRAVCVRGGDLVFVRAALGRLPVVALHAGLAVLELAALELAAAAAHAQNAASTVQTTLDTTDLTIDEVVTCIAALVAEKGGRV